jgi:hypothetical protein
MIISALLARLRCSLLAVPLLLAALPARAFDPASYNPAILSLSFSEQPAPGS